MLTISKPLSAMQARTYHAKEFTAADQNYWKQGNSIQGEWHGKLAEKLGLSGTVGVEEFAHLSEGRHPHTKEQLVRSRKVRDYQSQTGKAVSPVEHRAGWDATFSAPKSVSLAALVGGDERVRQAHREAVNAALDELEGYTQARMGGNHPAESTFQFVAAKFEHDTSRPVNGYAAPQLHTHVVIFNMTERGDGSTRALQPKALYDSQKFATAVYQSQLTYQLRALGYEIVSGRSGAPEIKGFTQEYLDASSPRRQQIVDAVAQSGFSGPKASQIAAHNTRDGKQILSPSEVMSAHRQIAAEFGNQADQVVAEAGERLRSRVHTASIEESRKRAHAALTFARDRNFEREAVVDERVLLVDAMRRGMGEVRYPEILASFEERTSSGEFRGVGGKKYDTGRRFTTAETIRAEREIVQNVMGGQGRTAQIMTEREATGLVEARSQLNRAQHLAIQQVLTSRDQVQGLQGVAGAGKTTTLSTIRHGGEQRGYRVEGFAPTSRAAHQLREAGISANTLQAFLARGDRKIDPSGRWLYILDESSLASTQQMRDFLARLNSQDKVLLVGDTRQHQGIDAGKPFQQLQQAGMRTAQLDQIVRQRDPELLKAVEHLSRHETEIGVRMLQRQSRVTEIVDRDRRFEAIARAYAAQPDRTIIVSPDNASRRDINQVVRKVLQSLGALETDEYSMRVLAPRSDMTGADRAWAARYQPGDVLHYIRGSRELGLEGGSYARVMTINARDNLLSVQKRNGEEVIYDPSRLRGIFAYHEIEREFAVGDRIQFTATSRVLRVANRDLGTLQQIAADGTFTVRMDDSKGTRVTFNPEQMRHYDHGYAVTSHSSQGLTASRALIHVDTHAHPELINSRFAYVSVSRASHDAQIYTNNAALLAEKLSHHVTKASAVEVGNRQGSIANVGIEQNAAPRKASISGLGLAL
jgi:conjugative relaxase-like TrwC/TraI family protein